VVVEPASDAIFTIDQDSTILFANPGAERLFGYSREELIGCPLTILMPEYLRHIHRAGLKRYIDTGRRHISWQGVELPGLHKSGREIPVEISFGELLSGGQHLFTGVVRDISERKNIEQTRSWLAAIVENSEDAIIGKTLDGVITSWNKGAENLYGYCAEEVIGRSISMLIPPDQAGRGVLHSGDNRPRRSRRALRNHRGTQRWRTHRCLFDDLADQRSKRQALRHLNHRARHYPATPSTARSGKIRATYRLLFNNNPQPMWVYDCETLAFLAVNNAAIRSYGYTREEFLGMTIKGIRPAEDIPALLDDIRKANTALHTDGPWRHKKKDGTILVVEISAHPIQFGDR
jgi:PAS domain S-box-containing protein